jgi:hypothetical protein
VLYSIFSAIFANFLQKIVVFVKTHIIIIFASNLIQNCRFFLLRFRQNFLTFRTLNSPRFEKTGTPDSSNTPTSPLSTHKDEAAPVAREGVASPPLKEGVPASAPVSVPVNGNGVAKTASNSTFKSPPHQPHVHNDQESML